MKKLLNTSLIITLFTIIPLSLYAFDLRIGEQPNISRFENVNSDVYIAGSSVQSSGNVSGDLIAFGGTVILNGVVDHDIFALGGSVTILGNVSDDARIGGGNVVVGAKVAGDLIIGGGQVQITGEGISGSLLIGGGVVSINAPIGGNIKIGGGDVYLNSSVGGNVEIYADKIVLGKSANIGGNFIYKSKENAILEEGSLIAGKTINKPLTSGRSDVRKGFAALVSAYIVSKFLMLLVASLILGLYFKRFAISLIQVSTSRPLFEVGRGLVTFILLPIVSIILMTTIIGIPFGILGIIGFIGLYVFGTIATQFVLGSIIDKWMFKKEGYEVSWRTILLGSAIYAVFGIIPIIGWLINCIFMLLTIGAIIKLKFDFMKTLR